jgi:predicted DNA-binding transcriptional regulator YafY
MRASRLLSILILLQTRGRLTAEALAAEFEVSVRTIYRDIDELTASGVPVYAERGRAGGFALLDGYRTRLTGMTVAESDALVLAGAGSAARDLGVGLELAAARLKLLASLPPDSGVSADRVSRRFHLDTDGWYRRSRVPDVLPDLAAAVWGDRRIRIAYEGWKGAIRRDLDPLGLVLKGGLWYLVGASEGKPRTYRVSNITALTVLEAVSGRPVRFDLERYWEDWRAAFESRLMAEKATVRLSPEGLRRLRIVSPAAAEAVDARHRAEAGSGWVTAEIPIESVADATRVLLYPGPELEVLAPAALRRAIATAARDVADLYG